MKKDKAAYDYEAEAVKRRAERTERVRKATEHLLRLEKTDGHQGVLAAIRDWLKKPYRGDFS